MGKIYKGLQIAKYTEPGSGSEPGDVGYVPRNERSERIFWTSFRLQDVITWSECIEEFYTYFDKREKIIIEMKHGANDTVLIESFKKFSRLMEEHENQQNPFITIGKQ